MRSAGSAKLAGLGLGLRDLDQVVEYRGHLRRLSAASSRYGEPSSPVVAASVSRSVATSMPEGQDQAHAIEVRPGQTLVQRMRDRQHAIDAESSADTAWAEGIARTLGDAGLSHGVRPICTLHRETTLG